MRGDRGSAAAVAIVHVLGGLEPWCFQSLIALRRSSAVRPAAAARLGEMPLSALRAACLSLLRFRCHDGSETCFLRSQETPMALQGKESLQTTAKGYELPDLPVGKTRALDPTLFVCLHAEEGGPLCGVK